MFVCVGFDCLRVESCVCAWLFGWWVDQLCVCVCMLLLWCVCSCVRVCVFVCECVGMCDCVAVCVFLLCVMCG